MENKLIELKSKTKQTDKKTNYAVYSDAFFKSYSNILLEYSKNIIDRKESLIPFSLIKDLENTKEKISKNKDFDFDELFLNKPIIKTIVALEMLKIIKRNTKSTKELEDNILICQNDISSYCKNNKRKLKTAYSF